MYYRLRQTRARRLATPDGTPAQPARIEARLEAERPGSYREAAAAPRLVLSVRARMEHPYIAIAFCVILVALITLAAVLPAHFGAFDVAVLAVLGMAGALMAYAMAGALLNRAVITVTDDTIELGIAPLPWRKRHPALRDVAAVDAVQRVEQNVEGALLATSHTLRVRSSGQRDVEVLDSFALSEPEASYLASRIRERLRGPRIATEAVPEAVEADETTALQQPSGAARRS